MVLDPSPAGAGPNGWTLRIHSTSASASFAAYLPPGVPVVGGMRAEAFLFVQEVERASNANTDHEVDIFGGAFLSDPISGEPRFNCIGSQQLAEVDFDATRGESATLDTIVGINCYPYTGGSPLFAPLEVFVEWSYSGRGNLLVYHSITDSSVTRASSRTWDATAAGTLTVAGVSISGEALQASVRTEDITIRCLSDCGTPP